MIFDILSYIGKKLNEEGILWGVGASILLHHYGLTDAIHDIDILVAEKDIEKVDLLLMELGHKNSREKSNLYLTKHFYEYKIKEVDVDVMAGLIILSGEKQYEYHFDECSVSEKVIINHVEIPFTSLEDWYILYQLIPGREAKVKAIEAYFYNNGIKNPALLRRAISPNLPSAIRSRSEKLL